MESIQISKKQTDEGSKERLLCFLRQLRMGQNAFEKSVGITVGHISKVKKISFQMAEKISSKYPELNMEWLLAGKGQMLKSTAMDKTSISQRFEEVIKFLKSKRLIYNESDFCQQTGIGRSFLSDMKSSGKAISKKTVTKITTTFPMIDSDWFLTGIGQMLKPKPTVMDKGLTVEKLTKREYFAGLAMQAALTARFDNEDYDLDWEYDDNYNWDRSHAQYIGHYAVIARHAVNFADALLEELSKK